MILAAAICSFFGYNLFDVGPTSLQVLARGL